MAIEISISASRSWDKEYLLELGENRPELLLFYGHKVTKTVTETCLSQWYPCKFEAVSYTHLDVYKRQILGMAAYSPLLGVVGAIIGLLLILVFSYRQTIDAYPHGGGSYIVASDNLGKGPGLIAAASLSRCV